MKHNPKKRLAINFVAILIIGVVAFLAIRGYQTAPKAGSSSVEASDLPELTSLVVETKVEPTKVQAAIVLNRDGEEAFVADVLDIYAWGRDHFRPIKCGDEYPPNLCQIGEVHIVILIPAKGVPSTNGESVDVYMTLVELWLDQTQIDVLFSPAAIPTSFAELDEFHASVAQQTQGTGGGAEVVNEIFTGLK